MNGAWHGQIVHLASQESAYFVTFAQAETFISRFADGLASQAQSQDPDSTASAAESDRA